MADDSRIIAGELQRQMNAFGQARTPLELQTDEERIVVAGSQIFAIPRSWSFQQFLMMYGVNRLGVDWVRIHLEEKTAIHPLANHILAGYSGSRSTGRSRGELAGYTMNGDMYAFLSFSYDMFTLADNARVQDTLLSRVRHADQFQGARYEIFVAASLLRGGFSIEFENERDLKTSHCEFAATSRLTKKTFSVEAKSRHRNPRAETPMKAGMYRLLQSALSKSANHERIIFADVNLPGDIRPVFRENWHHEVMSTLTELETRQRPNNPWPQALVFFTNRKTSPWSESDRGSSTVLLTAINHALTKIEDRLPFQTEYPEIGKLFHATTHLSVPPSEFFGQFLQSIKP